MDTGQWGKLGEILKATLLSIPWVCLSANRLRVLISFCERLFPAVPTSHTTAYLATTPAMSDSVARTVSAQPNIEALRARLLTRAQ